MSYLSRTLQVFIKSIAGERRTTSGDFRLAPGSSVESLADEIKAGRGEDWRYHARQQKADSKHVVKEDRKAQQVLPLEEEEEGEKT